jgi:DNA-binding beta-propeller fold protein YncE
MRLYWVNTGSDSVQYYDFITNQVQTVHLNNDHPTAATVYRGKLYYANQDDNAIHVANKTTGADNSILRNNTGNFISESLCGTCSLYILLDKYLSFILFFH